MKMCNECCTTIHNFTPMATHPVQQWCSEVYLHDNTYKHIHTFPNINIHFNFFIFKENVFVPHEINLAPILSCQHVDCKSSTNFATKVVTLHGLFGKKCFYRIMKYL